MKKWRLTFVGTIMAGLLLCSSTFSACFFDACGEDSDKVYTVQYSYAGEVEKIEVKRGDVWSIENIPKKYGYEFLGLFDAAEGGTQYVLPSGSSVSEFSGKKDIVLYPQFKADEYTVILDYQGATGIGERLLKAEYGASLPELPVATKAHYNFTGWFTQAGGKGLQIADGNGLLAEVSVVNEKNFNLDGNDGNIYLYAAFTIQTHAVTYHFGNGMRDEVNQIDYGTHISEAVPSTRNQAGEAVLSWKDAQGNTFNGYITSDMDLYAAEFAPVIELDVNGGDKIAPIVARAGAAVTLPTPTKDYAKFLRWEDDKGKAADITVMPSESISFKAVWQAQLVFDENGGSAVKDISQPAGEAITLPEPEKEGYIFAGWYTDDRQIYMTQKMPAQGVGLKAGWYTAKEKMITLVENNLDKKLTVDSNTLSAKRRIKIDLSETFPNIGAEGVEIKYTLNFRWGNTYKYCKADAKIALYESSEFNSNYELKVKTLSHSDDKDSYLKDSLSGVSTIRSNILYMYYSGAGQLHISLSGGYGNVVAFYDVNLKLNYPDITKLYL